MARPRVETNSKEDLRRRLILSEAMVTRFAERIRAFQAVHTIRVEETGLFIGMLAVLHRAWMDHEGSDGPSTLFVRWVESQPAEALVSILVGLDSSHCGGASSSGGVSPDENGDICDE